MRGVRINIKALLLSVIVLLLSAGVAVLAAVFEWAIYLLVAMISVIIVWLLYITFDSY